MSELGSPGIAGDTAKLRREQRRRKLLMTSEERMRKIMGVSQKCEESKDMTLTAPDVTDQTRRRSESVDTDQDQTTSVSVSHGSQSALAEDRGIVLRQSGGVLQVACTDLCNRKYPHEVTPPNSDVATPVTGSDPMRGESSAAAAPMKPSASSQQAFCRFRTMFVMLVGFLVRVSFMFDVGQIYVQTIVNPFVALEMSILGFQKSAGMDLGSCSSGGMISALALLGVRQDVIRVSNQVLGAATNIGLDFAFYFFAFVVTHVLI